ncbi:MAG: nucleoside triphosphate pyrophosphohydrolase [Bacteroidota bacterium]
MNNHPITRLEKIMDELREQCPWDKKQTIHSLRQLTIEECHELTDAITDEDWKGIREELGDILLHVLFYTKIGVEQKQFNFEDVINGIAEKLIFRHPHIYGDVKVKDEEEVKRNWENLKLKEGKTSVLSGVPRSLPSLVQAMRLQEKASQVGFDWDNKTQVWEKVKEELGEVEEEMQQEMQLDVQSNSHQPDINKERLEEELGDLMFSIVNFARFNKIDPDNALSLANKKFMSRFKGMEQIIAANGKRMTDLNLTELDAIWDEVKKESSVH